MEELKLCPFCGGKATIKQTSKDGLTIRCTRCCVKLVQKVTSKHTLEWLQERMIARWNARYNYLTKESAIELCDSIGLNSGFFDKDGEEYILLSLNNPRLLEAYSELFAIAYSDI